MFECRSHPPTYISSSGEMKMSLKLMTCGCSADRRIASLLSIAHILMFEVLQQLQLSVCSLRQHRRAEGFHDLLHRNRLSGELVLRRAVRIVCQIPLYPQYVAVPLTRRARRLPCQPAASQCIYRAISQYVCLSSEECPGPVSHLLVISKVVPKICARTNSAIFVGMIGLDQFRCWVGMRMAVGWRWCRSKSRFQVLPLLLLSRWWG